MSSVILIILIVWGAYYFARWFFSKGLARLLMWLMSKQARKQYEQMFGQQPPSSSQQRRGRAQGWSPFSRNKGQRKPNKRRRSKIIGKDVGEYVEFEEISVYTPPTSHREESHKKYPDEPQISDAEWEDLK